MDEDFPPVTEDTWSALTEVEQTEEVTEWLMVTAKCSTCDIRTIYITPAGGDTDNMECPSCENMTLMEDST